MVAINFVKFVKFVCYSRFPLKKKKPEEEEEENQASSFFEVVFEVLHL